jgi:hypothetical protein
MSTIKDVLVEAREIISVPERWTLGANAIDAEGNVVDPCSKEATCWCAMGAMFKAAGEDLALHDKAALHLYGVTGASIVIVNDRDGREAALELLDQAIEAS